MGNIFLTIITILSVILFFISVLMYMIKDTVQYLALYTTSSVLGIIIFANQSIIITVIYGINVLIGLFFLIMKVMKKK